MTPQSNLEEAAAHRGITLDHRADVAKMPPTLKSLATTRAAPSAAAPSTTVFMRSKKRTPTGAAASTLFAV